MTTNSGERPRASLSAIPRGVWALGFVSLLMDVSSEMIHALLPVFLVSVLGASVSAVGLLEGLAEATASITKVFSGVLSDWLGKRKQLVVLGYGLAALTKPLFALAPSVGWVVAARLADRIGKGIRGAPRDALLADLTPPKLRGASFGLRQMLDTVGAFAGPLLAIATMSLTGGSFRTVFWVAVIPAAACVAVLVMFVEDPRSARATSVRSPLRAIGTLGGAYWALVAVAALFTLARFSEAFLILKVATVGLSASYVPLVLVLMNVAYAGCAYPAGWLSDRANRWWVVGVGAALLIGADLVLAASTTVQLALAASRATPETRLNTPNAVPRCSGRAASATSAAKSPCVNPMCRPQTPMPTSASCTVVLAASTRSAPLRSAAPTPTTHQRFARSESQPAG